MILRLCYVLLCLAALSIAQSTITTTNAAGQSIVQVITTDPVRGPVTTAIATVTPAQGPVTLTDPITTTAANPGPVGAPAATTGTPGGPTPFTYVTVVGGSSVRVADVFTPTRISTTPVTIPTTGTILDYSAYIAKFGAATKGISPSTSLLPPSLVTSFTMSACAAAFLMLVY